MKNWNELLEHEIQDLYDAERQLVVALPKMQEKADAPELKQAFAAHLAETEMHVQRLQQAAQMLGIELGKITCEGMKGLIKEGEAVLKVRGGDPEVVDAALIGAAQKVEHYEMVAYDDAISTAEKLGLAELAELLLQTLEEEIAASDKLSDIAEEGEDEELIDGEDLEEDESNDESASERPGRSATRGSGQASKASGKQRGDHNMANNTDSKHTDSKHTDSKHTDSKASGGHDSQGSSDGGAKGGSKAGSDSKGGSSSGGGAKGGSDSKGGSSSSDGSSKGGSSSGGSGSKGNS